jgi:hypothetical protein
MVSIAWMSHCSAQGPNHVKLLDQRRKLMSMTRVRILRKGVRELVVKVKLGI